MTASPALSRSSDPARAAETPAASALRDDPMRGIGLILISMLFFSCSDAASKVLSETVPSIQIAWIRYLGFAAIMVPAVLLGGGVGQLRSVRPGLQVVRALGLMGSTAFFIAGLAHLPMAEATATNFVSPLFVTALSIPLLRETVGFRRWMAVVVGLIGVLIVVRPGTAGFNPAAIFPVLSALCWALALIATRLTSGADGALTSLTWSAVLGLAVLSAMVPFDWAALGWTEILIGAAMAVMFAAAQWLVVLAYRFASASLLAPFSYSQLLWASVFGFLLFAQLPDFWTFVGAGIIAASGLYTVHRERIRTREQKLGG